MSKPKLYVFAISHYCEKARWALDYLGVDYELCHLAPGQHRSVARRLGCRRSALPILAADGTVVQGSGEIIDWAESLPAVPTRRLTPETGRDDCLAIEERLDAVAGVHTRRYYYSEAVVEHPETVRPIFTNDLGSLQRLLVVAMWGSIRKLMIRGMDLGAAQGRESGAIVDGELGWLDEMLADGRRYLVGDSFSRADLTAASLLAPLVGPPEHPVYANLVLPPKLAAEVGGWAERPSLRWVRDTYARHRATS